MGSWTRTRTEELSQSTLATRPETRLWLISARGIALRLFLTCWLVYSLHFATNIVRENYLALAIGDHLSFRVDEYAGLHPDLFEKNGYGWHIGNNPGASMVAAIPYALARPVIDRVVDRVNERRAASGQTEAPAYNTPSRVDRRFYTEAWRRGFDVKFGLAAFVMQSMAMAPISALGVVAMFYVLRCLFRSDKTALWLSLLYAFGTPVFFRTGFLNQNLMLGHFAFMGFIALWNPTGNHRLKAQTRFFLGGLAGGTALLCDYSGGLLLLGLFIYGLVKWVRTAPAAAAFRYAFWYALGALGPVSLLWFYQWKSFGHPFYPGQHWMPPVKWIDIGYQGVGWPQLELLLSLAFDYRYGLFISSPLLLLAVVSPFLKRGERRLLPSLELASMLAFCAALWVFFSGVNYTKLQFYTGIRYMSPMLPFLFVPASIVLMRFPRIAIYFIAIFSVAQSWCLAMYREVAHGLGVFEPVLRVFTGGFRLPALTTLSRMGNQYGEYFVQAASPLPLFAITAAILYVLWAGMFPFRPFAFPSKNDNLHPYRFEK